MLLNSPFVIDRIFLSSGISNGLKAIGVVALAIFVPAIAYFIYIVYKDPATPEVITGT